jgi:glycosyltransferase involved in cell wall biosynthesis
MQSSVKEIPIQILPNHNLRFLNNKSLEILKKKRSDVIYWFGNSLSGIYLRSTKLLQIPIVLHVSAVHYSLSDLKPLSLRELFSHWLHVVTSVPPGSLLVRLLNDDANTTIVVPSEYIRESLCNFGVSKRKIKVAPLSFHMRDLAFDESKGKWKAREDLGLVEENFIITYMGAPDTVRGTDTLIYAAAMLKSKLRTFKVIILSRRNLHKESKDEELLFRLIKKFKLSRFIKIVPGVLSREDIKNYLTASDVIALPFKITLSEPPLSILEAMALGKPVITTKTCGIPELVNSNRGLLVRPGDPKHLAQALSYLAQNPKLVDELGRRAKEYVKSLTTWDELAKWTAELLYHAIQRETG